MLKHSRIAVIIFRNDQDQPVRAIYGLGKLWVLDRFARIFKRKIQFANVNKLSDYAFAPLDFAKNKLRYVFAGASFSRCAQNYRKEKRPQVHLLFPRLLSS